MTTPHDKALAAATKAWMDDRGIDSDISRWRDSIDIAISSYLSSIGGIVCAREPAEWQGRYWINDEQRWSNWITNPSAYSWAYTPQEGKYEIRDLHAPLSIAGKGDGGMPIETAPKDRTIILLWQRYWLYPVMGYWSNVHNGWIEYGSRDRKANVATHYRPLPAPPSLQSDTEGWV